MKSASRPSDSKRIVVKPKEATTLLHGLEAQRKELGGLAEELISLLREAGIGGNARTAWRLK